MNMMIIIKVIMNDHQLLDEIRRPCELDRPQFRALSGTVHCSAPDRGRDHDYDNHCDDYCDDDDCDDDDDDDDHFDDDDDDPNSPRHCSMLGT